MFCNCLCKCTDLRLGCPAISAEIVLKYNKKADLAFLNFSNPEFRTRTFHMYVLIVSVAFAWIFLQCF